MGHWYTKDGKPCHRIVGKNGIERDTTLRDARKLNLSPSVSEIISVAAAPGLENWKKEQLKLALMTLPMLPDERLEDFVERAEADAKKQVETARDEGIRIHGLLEDFYRTGALPIGDRDRTIVTCTVAAIREHCGDRDWTAEHTFCSPLGYGGTIDIFCDEWLLDFKTKDVPDISVVKGWPNQAMQLAAYKHGIDMPNLKMLNVFVNTQVPGEVKIYEHEDGRFFPMFLSLLEYWQLSKDYVPNI